MQLCATETEYPDEIVVSMEMSARDDPTRITLRTRPPVDASNAVVADYREALHHAEVAVRGLDAGPIVLTDVSNVPVTRSPFLTPYRKQNLVKAGSWMMALASIATSIVGGAIAAGSSTSPGTSPVWPFVPFVGMTVFSATYTQVSDCNGRPAGVALAE